MGDIDVVGLAAVIMGISVILVPVIGFTARFALNPTVEALAKFFEIKGDQERVQILERRISLMEQQMEGMERVVQRIEAAEDFERRLQTGRSEGPARAKVTGGTSTSTPDDAGTPVSPRGAEPPTDESPAG